MSPMQAWMPGEGPLTDAEVTQLARYNSERSRGIMHSADHQVRMAALQERFNRDAIERASRPLNEPDSNAPTVIALIALIIMFIVTIVTLVSVISSLRPPNV